MRRTSLLVIGAGPYGLAVAALARRAGIDCLVVGRPMEFWTRHMPRGMLLRSGVDWHLDARGEHTFRAFLAERRIAPEGVEPIPVELYLDYADSFRARSDIEVDTVLVSRLGRREDGGFVAERDGGDPIIAPLVVAAPGLEPFKNLPAHPVTGLPPDRWSHTCDLTDFAPLAGRRCLIVGGRQSAFESAALLAEAGATEVHVCHRHETPRFVASDWSWVDDMITRTIEVRGWFRRLSFAEREAIQRRFWEEGRLKLEPWLAPRIARPEVRLWPKTSVADCALNASGAIEVHLDDGTRLEVDHAILATGYRVDVGNVPYLADLLPDMRVEDGSPVLSESFESSVPGLFMTGLVAARDFGPFFGFVRGCPAAARLIVERLAA